MITQLPTTINSIDAAKAFLTDLYNNGESFHPEDDAHNIDWNTETIITNGDCEQLNKLMNDISNLPGNFDPSHYLLILAQNYSNDELQKAVKSGKFDFNGNYTYCIEKNPDQYREFWTMDIINDANCIEDTYVYWSKEDAENDAELLEHITNIDEC